MKKATDFDKIFQKLWLSMEVTLKIDLFPIFKSSRILYLALATWYNGMKRYLL